MCIMQLVDPFNNLNTVLNGDSVGCSRNCVKWYYIKTQIKPSNINPSKYAPKKQLLKVFI